MSTTPLRSATSATTAASPLSPPTPDELYDLEGIITGAHDRDRRKAARVRAEKYRRDRRRWQQGSRPTGQDSIESVGWLYRLMRRVYGWGGDGAMAGRVWHRMRLPAQEETSAQLQGCYPFLAGQGLDAPGVYIGQDRFTRSAFTFDPFELYKRGLLSNPNMLLCGVIGTGKSSLLKTMMLRNSAFGRRFFVPADTKGETVDVGRAIGANVISLGPGRDALNPLFAPPRPSTMTEDEYTRRVEQHRLLLLTSLGETAAGRRLTAKEELLLELAMRDVTGQNVGTSASHQRQPSFPRLVEAMLDPSEGMMAEVPVNHRRFRRETEDVALLFRSMVRGSLKGVFDGEETRVDLDAPGVIIDISQIRASDAAVALTMTCGQALSDLCLTFSTHLWLKVLDECWRQVRYPAILRRISEGQKLARGDSTTTGSATIMALHRISDLMGSGSETRELALGLLADTGTRVVYAQASDQLELTKQTLSLTDVETELLPMLGQGCGLWKIGNKHSAMVDHRVLRNGMEWPLIETDSRMSDEGHEEYRTLEDPAGIMAEEMETGP